jgi:hypothetical protein
MKLYQNTLSILFNQQMHKYIFISYLCLITPTRFDTISELITPTRFDTISELITPTRFDTISELFLTAN